MKREAIAAGILVLITGNARAHIPTILPHDTSSRYTVGISAPIEKSMAFYAALESAGDVDTYGFTLQGDAFDGSATLTDIDGVVNDLVVAAPNGKLGRLLHIGSLVPACQAYASVLPTVAVVGPMQDALPTYDGSVIVPKGMEIRAGEGVMFLPNQTQGPVWYEKFTYKSYFDQNQADIVVTEEGQYRIYVWDADGGIGDYVLETGNIEVFGFREVMQTLFWVTHVIYDGEISSKTCKQQLAELDGPNPNMKKVLEDYQSMFGN
jgi:hypothetical protein